MTYSDSRAIEVPHPGLSYNPTLAAHQELLQAVKERELKIIKQEEHLNRVTTSMFNKMPAVERDIFKLKELRSGIDEDDDDENEKIVDSDDEDNNEFIAVNPPVEVKKKDKKARRKQKEQRLLQQKLLKKKLEKKQIVDINR